MELLHWVKEQFTSQWGSNLPQFKMRKFDASDRDRLLAGAMAGACCTMVGHPIDSVKVRVQISQQPESLITLMTNMYKNEGIKSFFRGIWPPTVAKFIVTAQFFTINGYLREWLIDFHRSQQGLPEDEDVLLTLGEVFGIGALSGILLTPFISPFELVKVQLQGDKMTHIGTRTHSTFTGPLNCANVIRQNRQLTRGCLATACSLIPGWGVYMWTYEAFNRWFDKNSTLGKNDVLSGFSVSGRVIIGGGLAGITAWLTSYPFDYVKTQIQSHPLERWNYIQTYKKSTARLRIRDIVWFTTKQYGVRGFYKGIGPCLVRSVPVNLTNFWVYEFVYGILQNRRSRKED